MSEVENTQPAVDQSGNVQVTDAPENENERPLDKDGFALVPGTDDEQIVADRVDGVPVGTDATKDYSEHVNSIVESLGELAHQLGNDLSDAVLSDVKAERVAGVQLRLALEAVLDAQRAVAGVASVGGPVGVRVGV